MTFWTRSILAAGLTAAALLPTPAGAGVGDLLVPDEGLYLVGLSPAVERRVEEGEPGAQVARVDMPPDT